METITRHLDELLAFHLVARELNYTRAAEELGLSKTLVSRRVQRLEAMLGHQLLQRSTRSVRLTAEGRTLQEYSRKILELSDEATRRLGEAKGADGGTIRIATPVSLGDAFFPSFASAVRKALPNVTIEANLSNESLDFRRDGVDFALRATDPREGDPGLTARSLGRLRDVICATPALSRSVKGEDPRVLAKMDCITSTLDPDWNRWRLHPRTGIPIEITVGGKFATNQYGTARLMACEGLGVARLPHYLVRDDLRSGRLIELFPKFRISTHSLFLVYEKRRYPSPREEKIRALILKWFDERRDIFY